MSFPPGIPYLEQNVWAQFTEWVARCTGGGYVALGPNVNAAGNGLTANGTSLGIEFDRNELVFDAVQLR